MSELHVKIGILLKLERKRQGIALDDLSTKLKISPANLEHIEAGNLDSLPSELYFNLFAKSYAEALGIDYTGTVEAIKEDIGQPLEPQGRNKYEKRGDSVETGNHSEKETMPFESGQKAGGKFLRKFAFLFGIIVGLFIIFMLINMLFFNTDDPEHPTDKKVDIDSTGIPAVHQPVTDGSRFANYDWNVPPYQKPSDLQLKLVANQESWTEVFADGDTSIYLILRPGRSYTVTAKYRLEVSTAVPSVVDIKLNGTPVDLRHPTTGQISRVEINQTNLDSILNLSKPVVIESQPIESTHTSERSVYER